MLSGRQYIVNLAVFAVLASASFTADATAAIWFVDRDSANTTTQDGLSWATAFTTLQPAIDAAHAAGGGELWVAAGVYGEQRVYIDPDTSRNIGALLLREGVALYGGFAGHETLREHRRVQQNRTIIDGARAREGEPARQVIIGASNTVLDGVEVTGGDAGFRRPIGGGLRLGSVQNVRIANCTFSHNSGRFGGALRVTFSTGVLIERCVFTENEIDSVGVPTVYFSDTTAELRDSSFIANKYESDRSDGGIVRAERGSVTVLRCHFERNEGTPLSLQTQDGGAHDVRACDFVNNDGGEGSGGLRYIAGTGAMPFSLDRSNFIGNRGGAPALRIRETGELQDGSRLFARYLTVRNCSFINNESVWSDDPIVLVGGANFTFEHCTVAGNQCDPGDSGGMIMHSSSSGNTPEETLLRVRNSIFWNASSPAEINPAFSGYTAPLIEDAIVRGGYSGVDIYDAEPQFLDLEFGDFRLDPASPGVDQAQVFDAVAYDVFAAKRPAGGAPDLGAYEFQQPEQSLCEQAGLIESRLIQFPAFTDVFNDLDGDGLPEIASLRLLAFAACPQFSSAGLTTEAVFTLNSGAAHTEPFDTRIQRRKPFVAAMMSVSISLQDAFRDAMAGMGGVLLNDYAIVGCDASGKNCAATASTDASGVNAVASGPGDFDGDGMTNAEEWAVLALDNGTLEEFIAAATNSEIQGVPSSFGSGGGGGGGCFIATAAFGTSMAGEIDALRAARDQHLLTNVLGAAFTDTYYRLSPPIAEFIAQHDSLRAVIRRVLSPAVAIARWINGDTEQK